MIAAAGSGYPDLTVRLRVTYARAADFAADHRDQIARGGLLVRVAPASPPERGAEVDLELVTPVGAVRLSAQVIQVLAGAGVAVAVDPAALAGLARAAASAPPGPRGEPGHESRHEIVDDADGDPHMGEAPGDDPEDGSAAPGDATDGRGPVRPGAAGAALARKVQLALHGDKNQRTAILRENNRMLHGYVIRNAQIQLDEVVAIARMTTTSTDVLIFIASRREWAERSEVAAALVRNPRTPVPLAIRMLDHVSPSELRQLAKQQSLREAIQRVARKKVIG